MSHSSSPDIKALKGNLLSELLSELDIRFSELRSELFNSSLKSVTVTQDSLKEVNVSHDSLVDVKVTHPELKALGLESGFIAQPTISQLSERFGCDPSLVRKQKSKYRDEPDKFIAWSKSRDPDGRGWHFDETAKLFVLVDG